MALPGDMARRGVPTAEDSQVQPAGIDLRVESIEFLLGEGVLGVETREVPVGERVEPVEGWWSLGPGAYRIRFLDVVEVPGDAVGICLPRSSLMRMGASLHCAVWDPGYKGRGQALLVVHNPYGLRLEARSRIAQMVFIRLAGEAGSLYKGNYQGEGL